MTTKQKVLIVDDTPENIHILMEILKDDYVIIAATNGEKALQLAIKIPQPDIILLDVMMPEIDGYIVCQKLKENPQTQHIPVIFVTALTEVGNETKGLEMGAVDYIVKPINPLIVKARLKNQLTIQSLYQEIKNTNQELTVLNRELEDRVQERTAELEYMLMYDQLTGLPSKNSLIDKLTEKIAEIKENKQRFTLFLLDGDRFNLINSSLGYTIGDELLIAIADRLKTELENTDFIARITEDDFGIIPANVQNEEEAFAYAERLLKLFNDPLKIRDYEVYITVSMGITLLDESYTQALDILRDSDTALRKAKAQGKGSYFLFKKSIHTAILARLNLENDLWKAVQKQEFVNYYQPIIDLKTGHIAGFEALVRWQHSQRGIILPNDFIPCVEETGLIIPIGLFVFRKACEQLQIWRDNIDSQIFMSINLSIRQFTDTKLLNNMENILTELSVNPKHIKLEITESVIMENTQKILPILHHLRTLGVHISIDDFGTGYSSLGYIKDLPIDCLKIDRTFIKDISVDGKNAEITKAIISLGHTLGKTIVAEGTEYLYHVNLLKSWGCEYAQGYLFAKPLTADHATLFLQKRFQK
jgi:diguanylate cyclase